MAKIRRPEWAVCRNYGDLEVMSGNGASVAFNIPLVTATEIAFYEDRFRIKRIMGQLLVSGSGTNGVQLDIRLRMGLETLNTGTVHAHGGDLRDPSVAEEGFLNEKRMYFLPNNTVQGIAQSTANPPWWTCWDQTISRTLEPGQVLMFSAWWINSEDMVNVTFVPLIRFLVETS